MKAFLIVNMAHDGILCIILFVLLHRTRSRLFHLGQNLFPKLMAIIFECMLPPMIVTATILAGSYIDNNDGYGWVTIFYAVIGPLYFHSVIISLVSRKKLRELLDSNLTDHGILKLNSLPFNSKHSQGSHNDQVNVHVDQISSSYTLTKDRPRLNRDLADEDKRKIWDEENSLKWESDRVSSEDVHAQ
ncbi:hypothetical protein BD324DRAFT_343661 [Kockovaella imperatae]|uniref:DUF6534 domain-containing protein n=1 Tax=Kockovaella imperatae TaxID=4999 RepID=A0A1Y1UL03_9TREE|nr:hypothetical protein BD324DRAFT_343661 [Kockovaella imperatae]ORX38227.1 hypothetical protein BD324DRAFT_343661 [Kockovaella imperatae]